jgi:hypothetical protein
MQPFRELPVATRPAEAPRAPFTLGRGIDPRQPAR